MEVLFLFFFPVLSLSGGPGIYVFLILQNTLAVNVLHRVNESYLYLL